MTTTASAASRVPAGIDVAGSLGCSDVLIALGVTAQVGLGGAEIARRQEQWGPNAVSSHRARFLPVLWHQLRSPLLA